MKTFKILGVLLLLFLCFNLTLGQTLLTPSNDATGVDKDLTVTWEHIATLPAGATAITGYQIQASIGDPNFWSPQVDVSLGSVQTYNFSNLSLYTTYYWRVIADYDNGAQTTSQVWSFTVGDGTTTANVPQLSMPVDEATWGISTTPTLAWWYLATGPTTYTIDISDGAAFTYSTTTTSTSFEVPATVGLVNGTTYFWTITADGQTSEEWEFTPTSSVSSTNKPQLSAPVNNATWGITTTPTLSWWYVASGTTTYTIDINDGAAFTYSTKTTSTSFEVPATVGLVNGTTYYWTITADGQTSDEWNFTPTSSGSGTAQLILNSPIDGGVGKQPIRPTLSWRYEQATGTSFNYNLLVSVNSDLSSPIVNQSITDDAIVEYNLTTDLAYNTVYYWAVNVDGGSFTDTWSFTTVEEVTATPVFAILDLEVTNDDSTSGSTPSIPYDVEDGWSNVTGNIVTGYSLQLDDITAGSEYYYLTLGTGSTLTVPLQNDSYYPFYLESWPTDYHDYWLNTHPAGIDVSTGAPTLPSADWRDYMWYIIQGELPIFYIYCNEDGDLYLIDGLMKDYALVNTYFQINDDYLLGNYTVKGQLTAPGVSNYNFTDDAMTIDLNFNDGTLSALDIESVNAVPYGSTVGLDIDLDLNAVLTIDNSLIGKFLYDETKLNFAYAETGVGTLLNDAGWSTNFYESVAGEISFIALRGTDSIAVDGTLFKLYFTVVDNANASTDITGLASDFYVDGALSQLEINLGTIAYETSAGASTLRGDADLDFDVTMDDAIAILNHLNEIGDPLTGQGLTNAAAADDVAGISLDDAMAVMNYLATGLWNYAPALSVTGESFEVSDPAVVQNNIVELPIEINSNDGIKNVQVEFSYDAEKFDFQSFKAQQFESGMFTTAKEIENGKAVLTFISQEPISGNVKPGTVTLYCNDIENSSDISTKYRINSSDEYVDGPSINISSITDVVDCSVLPTQFELSQNYPNPFNPTTMIQYSMPEAAIVSLKIYNMLGQEVKTLILENKSAGVHTVQWNGENNIGQKVTSGIYIYRIEAGQYIDSKKLVLLK